MTDEQRGSASVYNLRVRDNSQADTDASQSDTTADSGNRVTRRTAATEVLAGAMKKTHLPRAVLTQCSTLSDPPTKKATLVHMQSNKTVVVDGSDADDTDALFDDAADT